MRKAVPVERGAATRERRDQSYTGADCSADVRYPIDAATGIYIYVKNIWRAYLSSIARQRIIYRRDDAWR